MELKSLFKNGRIPNKNLKAIDTGQLLQKDASISYMRILTYQGSLVLIGYVVKKETIIKD